MASWFRQLDELLRGKRTQPEALASGEVRLPLRAFLPLAIVLGVIYGFFMGWYAIFGRDPVVWLQTVSSLIKLPALFLLTLAVTFPSLYVFNALVGCRLTFGSTLRLLVAAIVVNLCVAASFGPILAFFTVSTTSYAFMVVLNVALLGVSGLVAMIFLLQTLRRLSSPPLPIAPPTRPAATVTEGPVPPAPPIPVREAGPLDKPNVQYPPEALGAANFIFQVWVIIYALVGAQMGWLLRPFILAPDLPFVWLRGREGDFFSAVAGQVRTLLGL
jgi:hypothetical protein